ncbi:MAG: SMP-30/gluconolactonase/LRE family protein [Bacteroidetes bacterium]|nr:SMP-30/gluconolactonase/LRE family protein [Bacteroidota bacterium]
MKKNAMHFRHGLRLILVWIVAGHVNLQAQIVVDSIHTVPTDMVLPSLGALGGLAVDRLGYVYMANFANEIWRINPEGNVKLLSSSGYGTSGITVDRRGDIYHANFYGNTISKIGRDGKESIYVDSGLSGPVGLAMDDNDEMYVCNCQDNSISKVTPDRKVTTFARSELFNCPNGITFDAKGNLYVVNFQNDHVVRITPDGKIERFATVAGAEGNAHIAYLKNSFYITKIKTNTLYRLLPDGNAYRISGNGIPDAADGAADVATLSRPNGIASDPKRGVLYVNNLVGEWNTNAATSVILRKVSPTGLTQIFQNFLATKGLDSAIAATRSYTQDEHNRFEDVGVELGTLGWAMMKERKVKEAISIFSLQHDVYPKRWRPLYYLGEVYKILGQNETAADYYRQALKLDPSNSAVKDKLNQLKQP